MLPRIGYLVLVLGFIYVAERSSAGLPHQDPTVETLRSLFASASPPKISDLRLHATWPCRWFSALEDTYYQSEYDELRFSQFGGTLSNDPQNSQALTKFFHTFQLGSDSFSSNGNVSGIDARLYIRKSRSGSLVGELVMYRLVGENPPGVIGAISNKRYPVWYYGVCASKRVLGAGINREDMSEYSQ